MCYNHNMLKKLLCVYIVEIPKLPSNIKLFIFLIHFQTCLRIKLLFFIIMDWFSFFIGLLPYTLYFPDKVLPTEVIFNKSCNVVVYYQLLSSCAVFYFCFVQLNLFI